MDDGSAKWGNKVPAIRFCTDSFTESEIDLLIDVINRKFNLKATKFINNNKWRLYFGTENYQQLKN
jgi:LAGLIDADG DNA endonuclease family